MKANKVIRISEKFGVEYSAIGKIRHTFPSRSQQSLKTFERKSAHLETSIPRDRAKNLALEDAYSSSSCIIRSSKDESNSPSESCFESFARFRDIQ